MYRSQSSRTLAERVSASMDQPLNLDVDISGLEIDYPVRTLIFKCYQAGQPFALADGTETHLVYFFPSHGCAVWCDAGEVTLNTFQDNQQFEKCIKMALVAHRKFVGVRQLQEMEQYREITHQLKMIG